MSCARALRDLRSRQCSPLRVPALLHQPTSAPSCHALVIGDGVVGTFLARALARREGARVFLKTRRRGGKRASATVAALCGDAGVTLISDLRDLRDLRPLEPAHPAHSARSQITIDYTYIATKTYDHDSVAVELARFPMLRATKATVLCHNGYLLAPSASFSPPAARGGLLAGPVFKACIPGGYSFENRGTAPPRLVVANGGAPWGIVSEHESEHGAAWACADTLTAHGLPAIAGRRALALDTKKFLINVTANLLSCIYDVNCAQMMEDDALVVRMSALFREADALFRTASRHARAFATAGDGHEVGIGLLPDTAELEAAVFAGVRSYGTHYPSTHADFAAGRRLEIESLNGYVVALGGELGIAVDSHRSLLEQVLLARTRSNRGV